MQQKTSITRPAASKTPILLPSQYLASDAVIELKYDEFCYHPNQIANFIRHCVKNPVINVPRFIKWLATATFCHPVLVKQTQHSIELLLANQSLFDLGHQANAVGLGENLVMLLEALNIFCLIKGFSLELLKISRPPQIHPTLLYAHGLWRNALPSLTKNKCFKACQRILGDVAIQPILQVIEFLNDIYSLRQKVTISSEKNNYYEQDYRNMASSFNETEQSIHNIDIQLSKYNCLVTAEYLPEDYHGEYIQVWVNRTVELNSLLGNFVCKEKFGEFQYVKGPLMYAMEKGIMLVLNNFEHISNELLVGMRTLAEDMKIYHNQRVIEARGGFKILGLCSKERMSTRMKQMLSNNQYIAHLEVPKRTVLSQLPVIQNQVNRRYLIETLDSMEKKMGLLSACKLWKRIQRARKSLVESESGDLWESFFTQGFKDSVELQTLDLLSKTDQTRTIHHQQKYNKIIIGRVTVDIIKQPQQRIVKTQYALSILQRLALCSQVGETSLLISQTGCGKTTLVQYLAELSGHHLYVYNMSSGTDVMDLVGGFKPIDCRSLLKDLFFRFIDKFRTIPGSEKNEQYLQDLMKLYTDDQLKRLLPSLSASITKIKSKVSEPAQIREWDELKHKFDNIHANLSKIDSNLVFSFMEGNLIKALRSGDWVLIDEINMATNDVLQKIIPLIEGKSLLLYEKGDLAYIERHPDFKIIACMNPANDSGKKALPPNLMEKFTAINLPQPLRMDVEMMIKQIAPQLNPSEIADIYFQVKKQKTISLRNLSRCLNYLNRNKEIYTFKRALYDALILGFQHKQSLKKFQDLTPPKPIKGFTQMHGFLVEVGDHIHQGEPQIFHLTDTFLEHLKDFLRAIAGTELPVLLEGPTSAGKTSIIRYVASVSSHKCVRINNHEHTEIQEYLGNYFPDKQGKLVFREGPLVQAVRQGHWLILDELNLARTQILECLNRLLDDNRELFIPEQQIHIKPHKNFRIFATQNPASYSGRKTLSRAFRNRFISLSFDDITIEDTMAIMKVRRPILNDSKQLFAYVKRTLQSLQNYRQKQRVFSKDSVITIRDLLKWTGRKFSDKESFMREGFALLVQRLRTKEEKKFVEGVLLSGTKVEQLNMTQQYERVVEEHLNEQIIKQSNIYVQMNRSFKRMAALTLKAVMNNEAVLLVGETGCGKTTLAELLASISGRKFYSINCHKHTQASDLLGCLRPCVKPNSMNKFQYVNGVVIDAMLDGAILLIDEINTAEDSVLERLNQVLESNNIGVQRGEGWETVVAKEGFCIIATMNPSGDYGKKELSPALRNRFTEIWVEPITHPEYIEGAAGDIKQMVMHKLSKPNNSGVYENRSEITQKIYAFVRDYNCEMAPRYGLNRKLLTMRDIGWLCKFMSQCQSTGLAHWENRYFWALRILAVEGVNFIMGQLTDSIKLSSLKDELIAYIRTQVPSILGSKDPVDCELEAISIVQELTFPLLIKTDLPLELLGIRPDERIFFSSHTQLTDLLGQFRPKGTDFVWEDESLLSTVKNGQRVALMDLNLAQQPVIEGINSLFDHRGSIFVVELNQMFTKNSNFRPVVVLKETAGSERRGLPNSFLNRFIKIRVKDVSKDVKLRYLQQKYPMQQGQHDKIWAYISRVLTTNPKLKIEWLEFVCQLYRKDQAYIQRAIQILNLPSMENTGSIRYFSPLSCEESLLKYLPMTRKHKYERENNWMTEASRTQQVKSLINCYIILRNSNFSVCLIGSVSMRENMVQWLGYSLKKNVVKVILSTMTDMADLLGSYEQVEQGYQDDTQETAQWIDLETAETSIRRSLQSVSRKHRQGENRKKQESETNFKYIESQIMKTVKSANENLLYIEVPNEMMLERVEKGIKCVYLQQVSIIVGVDCNPNVTTICSSTKFIPIVLGGITNTSIQNSAVATQKFFKSNHSELTEKDEQIRLMETEQWVQQNINQESRRNLVKAWQKLYMNVKEGRLASYAIVNPQIVTKRVLQAQAILSTKLGLNRGQGQDLQTQNNLDQNGPICRYFKASKEQLRLCSSKQQREFMQKIVQLFAHETLTANNAILEVEMDEQSQSGDQEQSHELNHNRNVGQIYNCNIAHKFRYLYVTDTAGGFRDQANRLLSLCYNNTHVAESTQLTTYGSILTKLLSQVQSLYLWSTEQHQQLLIPYSDSEHRLIPILHSNNKKSVYHYALTNLPFSVNKLAGLEVDLSQIVSSTLQKEIVAYMSYVGINVGQVGKWVWNVTVRDLVIFEMIANQVIKAGMDYHSAVGTRLKQVICNNRNIVQLLQTVIQSRRSQPVNLGELSPIQLAYTIFQAFKPKSDPYLNLSYHIQTEAQMKTLEQLAEEDKYYMEVYKQMCVIRYNGYMPNSYKNVETKVNQYQQQYQRIKAKRYVFRGYDNLKVLKDFYEELTRKCWEIEQSGFDATLITTIMYQVYNEYYQTFKDILWPILISLIIIQAQKITQKHRDPASTVTQGLLGRNTKSFNRAIELILHKEEQQFHDAAKNYTKLQRKFKNTVIIDEYTQEGVNKNKENEEEEFKEFFGKADLQKPTTVLDELYMLVRKRVGCKYQLKLLKEMFNQTSEFYQFVVGFELKFPNSEEELGISKISSKAQVNIYEDYSLPISNKLASPIPKILEQTKVLLSKYNIDSVKAVGSLCNKIQEHKAHDEVYKILVDCEFLIQKIYELYPVLPMAERISVEELEGLCMSVRKLELENWKQMLDVKVSRVEKSDTLDFIHFYRNFVQIGNIGETQSIQAKECFRMCDDFIKQSKISCYEYRLYLLQLVSDSIEADKSYLKHNVNIIINFYSSLREPIMEHWEDVKKQKVKQVMEFQKLTKWDSNNFLIFKQTCERFQKKIHRILKRYEEELSMQVGVFHNNLRTKLVCQSIQDFSHLHRMKEESERLFPNLNTEEESGEKISNLEEVVEIIFATLEEIKNQNQSTQSKMRLITDSLSELQDTMENFLNAPSGNQNFEISVLAAEMFPDDHPEYYTKAVKYYFGLYDRICQKTQTAWNRDIVARIWAIAQKIWMTVNSRIPKYAVEIESEIDDETDNLLILFDKALQNQSKSQEQFKNSHHPIFVSELQKIKALLKERQSQYLGRISKKYNQVQNAPQLICLMKIGYIVSSIALNLQRNGLCVKEEQEEGEQSEAQQVGDGVGIGEGEAHEGAKNVGDEIQFEEQLQGNKDEEKNNDANANKKQENDIQMEGDFEGDLYSKQEQAQGSDQNEGEQKEADQQMGEVDNQQREQDMKNDKGRAEGQGEADVEINRQQEGSEELVDNQQQEKQARKGENREQGEQQQDEDEKSDWDDNNEQGQKINKQKGGQMEEEKDNQEENSGESLSSMGGEEKGEVSGEESGSEIQSNENQNQEENPDQMENENEEEGSQSGNKDGEILSQEMEESIDSEQNEKEKKAKKTRRTKMEAYGRTDMNSNNPLKNNEDQVQNEQMMNNEGAADVAGQNEGERGSGEPVHSLSAELLKQIQNLERVAAKENAHFMKDLNVVAHDEQNEELQGDNQDRQQQYQLTEEQNKAATNLPAFLQSQENKQEQEKIAKTQENTNERKQKELKREKAEKKDQKDQSRMQKLKSSEVKQPQKMEDEQQVKSQQGQSKPNAENRNQQKPDSKSIKKQQTVLQVSHQEYLKSIVNAKKKQQQEGREIMKDQSDQIKNRIMEQAFDISKILQQQLKSVLEPMDNAEYRGDYKTGKKLNLKKIIPFIASNFRKDKIWLRRTEPSQRNYYIMIALDDTKSMRHGGVGTEALKGLLAISLALQHLSIKTCITGIRDSMNVYKNFQGLLEPEKIVQSFDFTHESQVSHDLSIASFMQSSLDQFKRSQSSETGVENRQLCFIISDGKMNKDYVRPYIRQAKKRDIIYVFIIVDSEKASILTTKSVSIEENGKVKMKLYMSDFPFEYFLIVRNVQELGDVLATTLLQFIQQK